MNRPAGTLAQVNLRVGSKAALGSWASSPWEVDPAAHRHTMAVKN